MIDKQLSELQAQHENAIAVFKGANYANESARNGDITTFCEFLPGIARNALFFQWHEGIAGALRRFCHMCLIDPALVEAYLGIRFKDVEKMYEEAYSHA